jgi:cytosine/uracil/thiamine/allantoin permease
MGKKNSEAIDILFKLPWWVSVIVSALIYIGIKWILPILPIDNQAINLVQKSFPDYAAFFSVPFLFFAVIIWMMNFFKKHSLKEKKLDTPENTKETVESKSEATQTCPQCGNTLLERVARKGPNPGSKFMGCSTYPSCKYTEAL